jgi:hypothetical protein
MLLVVGSLHPLGTGDSPSWHQICFAFSAAMSAMAWAGGCDWYLSRLTYLFSRDRSMHIRKFHESKIAQRFKRIAARGYTFLGT